MDNSTAVKSLAALAQDTRLAVFRLLVIAGRAGLPVGRIAEQLTLPAATLSFHLKELSQAGLITGRQDGRFIYYSANFPAMAALLGFLTDNCCGGEPCGVERVAELASSCCPPVSKSQENT
jgi:ArsR family transcriptional regulator, arsenate/arsenite/antimonite-responsive transcriptional repressor